MTPTVQSMTADLAGQSTDRNDWSLINDLVGPGMGVGLWGWGLRNERHSLHSNEATCLLNYG